MVLATPALNGGVRRGTDVLRTLALGAGAVLAGRPQIFRLAAGGSTDAARVVWILRAELELAMALTGPPSVGAIGRSFLTDQG